MEEKHEIKNLDVRFGFCAAFFLFSIKPGGKEQRDGHFS
jgi:hypothetical protein